MNTPQTWAESPIHEQIRATGLDPVNRTTNDTPTPETDEHEFPCMTWPSRAHPMVVRSDLARKLERERDEARFDLDFRRRLGDLQNKTIDDITKQRDEAREYADRLAEGLPEGMLPKDVEVLREANLNLATELTAVTEQRDKLIKAIEPLEYWRDISECDCSCPLPQGGCLRCDLNRILKLTNPNEEP